MECNVAGGYCAPKKTIIDPCAAVTCSKGEKCGLLANGAVGCQLPQLCNVFTVAACAKNRTSALAGVANITDCAIRALVVACAADSGCPTSAYCSSIPKRCAVDACSDNTIVPTPREKLLADMVTALTFPKPPTPPTQDPPEKSGLVYVLGGICVAMGVALIAVGMLFRRVSRQLAAAAGNSQQLEMEHRLI